jgi:hypothetical protein
LGESPAAARRNRSIKRETVQFILGQSSGIGQRLANIFLLKVR